MKKILYLHGFGSSGASGTVEVLRRAFWGKDPAARIQVVAPDIPVDPQDALPMLKALAARERPGLIVGTSMGGMYAQQLRGYPRICVNPSFAVSKLYSLLHVGKYKWLNPRRDGATTFHVYKETIAHYAEMEAHQFDGITDDDRIFCFALFGLQDEITAPSRAIFARHYPGQSRFFDGGHRLNADLVQAHLIPYIREIGV
ncbi:MAG: YqiA/YcfP family alpha/beta fold hydrolase [Kiritimatiellia bacterium]